MKRHGSKRKRPISNEPSSSLWANVKVVGIVIATLIGIYLAWWLPTILPFGVSVQTSATTVTISYSLAMYVMYLLAGGGMILAALKMGFARQLYHWLALGGGVVVIVFGMLYASLEKVEINQHSCSSRR